MAIDTALAPTYEAPTGLSSREALAHAHDHIRKLVRKHESVVKASREIGIKAAEITKAQVGWMTNSAFAGGTATALGYVNGRYGGEKGYVAKYGVALDAATAFTAHLGALALSLKGTGDAEKDEHLRHVVGVLHAVGDTAVGVGLYRWSHQKGVEAAHRAGVPAATVAPGAPVNGAAPKTTVYAVPAGK